MVKLRDLLAGVPLEGVRSNPELEINSISAGAGEHLNGALFVEVPGGGLTAPQALEQGAAAAIPAGEDPWGTLALLAGNWFCHPGRRMTLVSVAGGGDSELAAYLLRVMLESMPHTRVGAITPNGVWLHGVELPVSERGNGPMHVQRLLRRMADERCTHVILQLDDRGLERREYAGLRMSVTALTGPVRNRESLVGLLAVSDTVVLNLDEKDWEDYGSIIPEHTFTYSENKTCADLTAKNLRLFPGHMEFEAVTVGHIQRIHLPVPGGFSVYHGLCVLSCGLCLGLKWERMARVLRCVRGPQGRLEVLSVSAAYTVVLDRADSPRALEQLLTSVREFTAGRLICVLGCPREGGAALRTQLGSTAEQLADRIVLTGGLPEEHGLSGISDVRSGMGAWQRPCTVEPDRRQAIRRALEEAGPGDVIVLTGHVDRPAGDTAQTDEREFVRSYVRRHHARREKGVLTGG